MKTIAKLSSLFLVITMVGCASKSSNDGYSALTGWKYNDKNSTGFAVKNNFITEIPNGMVAIEGGSFTIGEKGEFITAPRDSKPRRITVSSFYLDQYEIRNLDWREYTNWMQVVFGKTSPKFVAKAQPDGKVWREELAYNEPYLENYFSHPAFDEYPVVGVSWEQAMDYCTWRTDRVNELALINAGVISAPNFKNLPKDVDSIANVFVFNTQKYLLQDNYKPKAGKNPKRNLNDSIRKVDMSDGILYSEYRLPTEAEWEFAAYAIISGKDGLVPEGKIYPWSGSQARNPSKEELGQMQANFVRGRGDMMGTSGSLNDKATITAPVYAYFPNDFGLFNMAGNVNEWVLDVYRATSYDDVAEYNSFRGNKYLTPKVSSVDATGHNIYLIDQLGRIGTEVAKDDDVRNYKDGDASTQLASDYTQFGDSSEMSALINAGRKNDITDILRPRVTNKTRVYKGGSWKDRIYWLNPSTRRYLDEDKSSSDIGFRCAMSMIGNIDQK
ncbi:MAG: SUMF1/EgtB/PvdO family nonheme iron enzyme [Paludibacter sp.]